MDILYVVGTGSKWNDNELRYSLRSIAMYGRNIDRVYIVGHKPDFVSNYVHYIPCDDPYVRKHKNILHKVKSAINKSDIGNHFLISSDDHFYLHEVDFDNLPVYYIFEQIRHNLTPEEAKSHYNRSLDDTYNMLSRYELPVYQTNPHCNTHFRTDLYRRNQYLFDEAMSLVYGGEMNCIMGNLMIANGAQPVAYKDSKLELEKWKEDKLREERLKDIECFSISDKSLQWGIGDVIKSLYPNKCKYER